MATEEFPFSDLFDNNEDPNKDKNKGGANNLDNDDEAGRGGNEDNKNDDEEESSSKVEVDLTQEALRNDILKLYPDLSFDDKNNLIDKNNKVVITQESLLKTLQDNIEEANKPISKKIAEIYKLPETDEIGNKITYSNKAEDVTSVVEKIVASKKEEAVNEFLNSNKELKEFYVHLQSGKTLKEIIPIISNEYIAIELKSDTDKQVLKDIILNELININKMSSQDAKDFIEVLETKGTLLERAKASQTKIKEDIALKTQEAEIIANNKKKQDADNSKREFEASVELIKKGVLHQGIKINEAHKSSFLQYMYSPVPNAANKTKYMLDLEKESKEEELLFAYLKFLKLDIKGLAKQVSDEDKLQKLRKLNVTIDNSKGSGDSSRNRRSGNANIYIPSVEEISKNQ